MNFQRKTIRWLRNWERIDEEANQSQKNTRSIWQWLWISKSQIMHVRLGFFCHSDLLSRSRLSVQLVFDFVFFNVFLLVALLQMHRASLRHSDEERRRMHLATFAHWRASAHCQRTHLVRDSSINLSIPTILHTTCQVLHEHQSFRRYWTARARSSHK